MDRACREVEESRLRKTAEKEDRNCKKLEDIRQEELCNDPVILDQAVRDNLAHPGDIRIVDQPTDDVTHIFKLLAYDYPDFEADNVERMDPIFSSIFETSNIDPCHFGPDSKPKDWPNSQLCPPIEAAEWKVAFEEECKLLKDMGVYKLVPCSDVPADRKIHRSCPVLRNKIDSEGLLAHRKVHFVFKGFEQIFGCDYTSTTSPMVHMESWRVLLHIAAVLGWNTQQIDIKTAFLYGLLPDNETQYMEQPQGFEEPGRKDWVWKLQRSLYGMKQAGRI